MRELVLHLQLYFTWGLDLLSLLKPRKILSHCNYSSGPPPPRSISVLRFMNLTFWVKTVSPPSSSRYVLDLALSFFPFSYLDPEKVMQSEWTISWLIRSQRGEGQTAVLFLYRGILYRSFY